MYMAVCFKIKKKYDGNRNMIYFNMIACVSWCVNIWDYIISSLYTTKFCNLFSFQLTTCFKIYKLIFRSLFFNHINTMNAMTNILMPES